MKTIAKISLFIIIPTIFFLGIFVGHYEIFPFQVLQEAKKNKKKISKIVFGKKSKEYTKSEKEIDDIIKSIFIEYNKYITDIIGYPIFMNSDIIGKSINKTVDILDYTISVNIHMDSEIELNIE